MQRVSLRHLRERRLLGIAGHHAGITRACPQVSQQCPEALHWQIFWCQVRLLLEAHRLRGSGGRYRIAALPVHDQLLILKQQRFPCPPQVPLDVGGQEAQQNVRPYSVGRAVMNRPHHEIDPFETPERLLD